MKKLMLSLLAIALALPLAARAASWEKVSLVDKMCGEKFKGKLDEHPVSCLMKCSKGGLGVVTSDGKWLALDKAGNEKAVEALQATTKKDHVRVNITGEEKGDTIHVATLTMAE
jgi:hypothetical protein